MAFTCSQCNAPLVTGSRFCAQCGMQFNQPVPPYDGSPQPMPSQQNPYMGAPPIQKKKRSPVLVGCAAVFGFFVVMGIIGNLAGGGKDTGSSSSPTSVSSNSGTSPSTPDATPVQAPDVTVSAKQLYEDYKANEVSADEKYKDKTIVVSGTVRNIGKDIVGTMYVTLEGDDVIGSVQCMFDDEYKGQLSQLQKGQHVTIQGTGGGYLMNALIKDSQIK